MKIKWTKEDVNKAFDEALNPPEKTLVPPIQQNQALLRMKMAAQKGKPQVKK